MPPSLERDLEQRTLAPLGRRPAVVLANEEVGAYRLIAVADRDGPADPRPGQFYMLASGERWGGGHGERPYLPRAFSFARVGEGAEGAARLEFLLEAIGPGTDRLGVLRPGEEMLLSGPFGVGFRPPPGGPAGAVLVGGGIGVAPIICWGGELGPDAPVLLGFRSAAHAEAARLFPGRTELCTDDGTAGRHALVTELLRERLDARTRGGEGPPTVYACGPPPMLEAVRAICAERDTPGQLALESGMACGFGACFGCVVPTRSGYVRLCVDGPVLDAAELETGGLGIALNAARGSRSALAGAPPDRRRSGPVRRQPARPDPERLRHVRRDRGAPHLRPAAAARFPVRRICVEDDHHGPAPGQPATAAVGDPGGPHQLDRSAQQGARGFPRRGPSRAGAAAGPAGGVA